MSYTHSSIEYNVYHLFDKRIGRQEIERFLRKDMKVPHVTVNKRVETRFEADCEKPESDYEDHGQDDVISFHGIMGFNNLHDGLNRLLINFCQRNHYKTIYKASSILLNFENIIFEEILTDNNMELKHRIFLKQFSFGTLAKLTSFVYHYSTDNNVCEILDDLEYSVGISEKDMLARFIHSCGEIHIHFRVIFTPKAKSTVKYRYRRYKLVIRYSSINHLILKTENNLSTYISVSHPPLLYHLNKDKKTPAVYKKNDDEDYLEITNEDVMFDSNDWSRCLNFPGTTTDMLGKCNVIKLILLEPADRKEIPPHNLFLYPQPFEVINSFLKVKKVGVYFGCVSELSKQVPESIFIPQYHSDYFTLAYAMEAIQSISFHFANELFLGNPRNDMDSSVRDELTKLADDHKALEISLFELFNLILKSVFVEILPFLKRAVKRNANRSIKEELGSNLFLNRKAILTPTRLILLPPYPMTCSRFILKSDPDYILRLLIRDDTLDKLTFSVKITDPKKKKEFFERCIKKPLLKGLQVFDRLYEVVGSSQSQLKENGICMYAKDQQGRTAASIISDFGVIGETNVSKYVSRVGLILSQAQYFYDVSDARIKYDEPDITDPSAFHPQSKKPYIFSDGCGMISVSYAEKLTKRLKANKFLSMDAQVPSAFQIRLGGCKGMLVVNPRLQEYDIVIRDSMRKFESNDKMLGVLKVSDKRKVYLNKPFTTVLNQSGIDTNVFLKMQMNILEKIRKCFLSEADAVDILDQYSFLSTLLNYKALVNANVDILNEPFIRMILDNVIRQATNVLRTKGRIQVPVKDGRTMFGVVDETLTLEYGQVFIQSSNFDNSEAEIWKGKVLVSKFPSIDSGDLLILEAIDVEALHHIKDCILFPAKGIRPHSNESSGGDVDGDEYAVIRQKELLNIDVHAPMIFPDIKLKNEKITSEKIVDFYVNYILNCSVGIVSHAHLAWADILGLNDKRCKRLALMASLAVDFAKTGINCSLKQGDRPIICPDFMEKNSHKPTYLSSRALGSLFRQICLLQIVFNEQLPMNFVRESNTLFEHRSSNRYQEDAKKAYYEYKHMVFNIQKTFKIKTEVELICGVYNNQDEYMAGDQTIFDSKRVAGIMLGNGVRNIRKAFLENCEDEDLQLAKVSAYYKFTREINSSSDTPYYGLPWLFSDLLSKLAKYNKANEVEIPLQNKDERLLHIASLIDDRLIEYNKMTTNDLSRVRLAEEIIISWLKRQTHLKLSLFHSQVLIEQKVRTITRNFPYCSSVGSIIINILENLLAEEWNEGFGTFTNGEHFKFTVGFSALTALWRLYSTYYIDHLILPRKITANINLLSTKSFRLEFFFKKNIALYEFVKTKESDFFKYLKVLSGIHKLKGEWVAKSNSSWHFELMAFGTATQIHALSFVLSKTLFAEGPNIVCMIDKVISSNIKKCT